MDDDLTDCDTDFDEDATILYDDSSTLCDEVAEQEEEAPEFNPLILLPPLPLAHEFVMEPLPMHDTEVLAADDHQQVDLFADSASDCSRCGSRCGSPWSYML
jgi:hypothetical protein